MTDRDETERASAKIRLRGVEKHFFVRGRRVDALAALDLDIRSGEFFCIVGPSGCGKTTLLRILAGLVGRSAGSIDIARDWRRRRARGARPRRDRSIPWYSRKPASFLG